jgi:hypothetical protein
MDMALYIFSYPSVATCVSGSNQIEQYGAKLREVQKSHTNVGHIMT